LWELTHPGQASSQQLRPSGRRGQHDATEYAECYSVPFSGLDASSSLPWWEPPANPTRVLLNPTSSPLPMGSLVDRF
jgi:hypothetical protein